VFGEVHLYRILKNYAGYYDAVRSHLLLQKDALEFQRWQKRGWIAAIAILGGLHHECVRV